MKGNINQHYDVIIVGAGPCGATAANLLGKQNISTLLIDREADIVTIPRAVGICEEGSRILDSVGLLDNMDDEFRLINRVSFNKTANKKAFHADTYKPINGHRTLRTFHQPALEKNLRQGFTLLKSVAFSASTELVSFNDDGAGVSLKLDKNGHIISTRCQFLLACDGASSKIRQGLGIGFKGNTYPQDWMILDIDKNPVASSEVIFTINPERPAVTLPGPGNKRRWEFVVKKNDDPETLFDETNLAKLLASWGDVGDMQISRKAIYTFHARSAENYQQGNVFLLGDSAHITPPFAGQGMMAGLRDCYNLCWKLTAVIQGKLSKKVLASYEVERMPQSRQVIKFAQRMGNIILPQNKNVARLRNAVISLLGFLGAHSQSKGITMNKIPNHINGCLMRNKIISATLFTGYEIPQVKLRNHRGEERLFDRHVTADFYLLGWNQQPRSLLDANTSKRWLSMGGKFLSINNTGTDDSSLLDNNNVYRKLFKNGNNLIVIRPDKMMVINCNNRRISKQLNRYMDTVGCLPSAA